MTEVALSPRERECLLLTAMGWTDHEIAHSAGIAATTVRFHLRNVQVKVGARNRRHAIYNAMLQHLLPED